MANIINTVNLISNPNDLAHTLDLGNDFIDPYAKIVIPNDSSLLREAVPIADAFFRLISIQGNEILNRIDLVHSDQTTTMTLNIAAGLVRRDAKLGWTDEKRNFATQKLKTYLQNNPTQVISLSKLKDIQVAEPFKPNNDTVADLVRVFDKHAKPMAAKHGGDYEITHMSATKPGLIIKKQFVTVTIKPDGACASCASFNITYGQLHKKMNEELAATGSNFRFKRVEAAPRQQAMILRR